MTIVIPDARTPAGVKCWVRDYEDRPWAEHAFEGMLTASGYPFLAYSRNWRYCRLDDPATGWVENTGMQPVADSTKVEVKFAKAAPSAVSAASNWHWSIEFAVGDITHWRYPRETKEKPMAPHPQADILRRIADGEDLKGRLWILCADGSYWQHTKPYRLIDNPQWTFAISDKPGTPPPLPRKMIQLRKDGPKYYQGETVAPGDEAIVWVACFPGKPDVSRWKSWRGLDRDSLLRLGLVHLSEANYKLHMAAQEDLLMWAHEQGGVK